MHPRNKTSVPRNALISNFVIRATYPADCFFAVVANSETFLGLVIAVHHAFIWVGHHILSCCGQHLVESAVIHILHSVVLG